MKILMLMLILLLTTTTAYAQPTHSEVMLELSASSFLNKSLEEQLLVILIFFVIGLFLFFKIKQAFGKPRKKYFSQTTKDYVRKRQGNKCNHCGCKLVKSKFPNADHINPKRNYDDSPENCQYLCKMCHDKKTSSERKRGTY